MKRLTRLRRDESGMTYVFVGLSLMALLSASMLAIDVGMLMTARSQAQNSADAGALAGATALVYDNWADRSAGGPAVTSAVAAAQANKVMSTQVSVTPADVEFENDPATASPDRVKVTVFRTAGRAQADGTGGPVSTLIAYLFGTSTVDIRATATAEAAPANAMTCVKPFTIPDKWIEKQSPPYDPTDTYDAYNNKGVPLANPDIYIPAYDASGHPNADYTGYNNESERGTRLTIRASTGSNIAPSMYFSLAMVDDIGGDDYRWNIGNCNKHVYKWGDGLIQEPGDMSGPTLQGVADLIARDPNATWNQSINGVTGSAYGNHSPRIFPIPLYDPPFYDSGKRNGREATLKTANWIGFFVEDVAGKDVIGRIIPVAGIYDKTGPAPNAALPKTIRLIR
jgi:Flp pilus assembly protein TadG